MSRPHPASRRRRLGRWRTRWRVAAWLLATAAVTGWWATQPHVSWTQVPAAAIVFGVLLGAALATA